MRAEKSERRGKNEWKKKIMDENASARNDTESLGGWKGAQVVNSLYDQNQAMGLVPHGKISKVSFR